MPTRHVPTPTTFLDMPALRIETPASTAVLSLFGAQLLSFVPKGGQDLLWVSPQTRRPPAPIRGGVPLCWPWFGRQGQAADAPAHGLVRTLQWSLITAVQDADGSVALELAPPRIDATPLRARLRIRVGAGFEQALETYNAGDVPVRFTQALHSYFAVGDATRVRVEGLDGLDYLDKFDGFARHVQKGDWTLADARDPGRSDRIYLGAGGRYVLCDPAEGRAIEVRTGGSRNVVVWNPGEAATRDFADLAPDAWRRFLCVEAANSESEAVELAPGASHALRQTVTLLEA
ncbi:D-hexose-6-phosphate mutarotase [Coralloluteibacterium stylophorae]|uniref:Putative glucose-6-phosphate 1-epimerase n=1 Tax=Coralloluteibacterium stylophorae TaxID=1776034 RepID=A0A8J7VT29_9GAMM|nr:D-hexose-6-phosphate mutarotase [Coralloluteibacterium stylophorae]MBS7455626.1 D-hexose-6-phosphate mutarotase [Coralloluteibacterium stylophorae]